MRPHPLLVLLVTATTSLACVQQGTGAAAPASGPIVDPVDRVVEFGAHPSTEAAPAPTSTDPSMPASLPPPAPRQALVAGNGTYSAGLTLVSNGGGLALAGGIVAAIAALTRCSAVDTTSQACSTQSDVTSNQQFNSTFGTIGLIGLVVGGIMLVGGIPLMVIGANQASEKAAARRSNATVTPVRIGPRGVFVAF